LSNQHPPGQMLDRLNLYFDQVVSKGPRFGILLYTPTHAREKSLENLTPGGRVVDP